MPSARALLAILGLAFAVAGVVLAWTADPYFGLAFLIVGAFLMFLPFTTGQADE